MPKRTPILFALLCTASASGCSSETPKAPPLTTEAVFQNDKVGIRFLAPEGWPMASRSDVPPGRLTRTVVLVNYILSSKEKPAEFNVIVADVTDDQNLGTLVAEYRIGPETWALQPGSESVTVGGLPGTRYRLSRTSGKDKDEYRREATAVRRGERVIFFVFAYHVRDPEHRDQARKSIESVTWTN